MTTTKVDEKAIFKELVLLDRELLTISYAIAQNSRDLQRIHNRRQEIYKIMDW